MDLYTTGTATPMLVYNGDSTRIGGNTSYWWEHLYPVVESMYNHFVIKDTPYKLGISGQYEPGDEQVEITIELLIDEIDSTLDNTDLYLELVVVEDKIPDAYWSVPAEYHDLRNVARRWITKNPSNKLPITITESGQNQIFETSFPVLDNWNLANIKIVAMVQMLTGSVGYSPIVQSQSANINELDPDPDEDGLTYLYDNCINIYNPDQIDSDEDGIGNFCDPCNELVNIIGNIDLDAYGDDYQPIIGVNDILALPDIMNNVGMPINDCHEFDILQDGQLNSFDIVLLEGMIMAGGE
tara:strand:+ start:535 stop:1425 length:891 start_codon:yes stop_codon:yes gene_type:complete